MQKHSDFGACREPDIFCYMSRLVVSEASSVAAPLIVTDVSGSSFGPSNFVLLC